MKTFHKIPLINPDLLEKIQGLTKEFKLKSIFLHPAGSASYAEVLILTNSFQEAKTIEARNWVKNAPQLQQTFIRLVSDAHFHFQLKKGNPFLAVYARKSALVYADSEQPVCFEEPWKSFKKKFRKFTEEFYHDHDILHSEWRRLDNLNAVTPSYLAFESLLNHDIMFLEIFYLNQVSSSDDLHQRIQNLARILPDLSGLFVKENQNQYYLINQIYTAKTAIAEDEETYLTPELLPNLREIEQKIYEMIDHKIEELKTILKSNSPLNPTENYRLFPPPENEIEKIAAHILSFHPMEEIYLFHQKQTTKGKTFYLLLVADDVGTSLLNQIQQSYGTKNHGKMQLVLIAHSRIWIQKVVFAYQKFFRDIMVPENKIFESHPHHPHIHWEEPYTVLYPDLDHYHKSALLLAENYFLWTKKSTKNNQEGLKDLFFHSLRRMFRTFIYAKLSYLPHYLSAQTLWDLCLYADPELENQEYIMEKIGAGKFFHLMEKYSHFHHDLTKTSKKESKIMRELLSNIRKKLREAVKSAIGADPMTS